jgi:ABC-type Na+ transport system ATPase subunit NatA
VLTSTRCTYGPGSSYRIRFQDSQHFASVVCTRSSASERSWVSRYAVRSSTVYRAATNSSKPCVCHGPDLLLLDEPSVGLDPAQRTVFRSLLAKLAESRSIVLSTHLVDDVIHVAEHVIVIADGAVVHEGPLESLAPADAAGDRQALLEDAYIRLVARSLL